jgi:hypothetical protein
VDTDSDREEEGNNYEENECAAAVSVVPYATNVKNVKINVPRVVFDSTKINTLVD